MKSVRTKIQKWLIVVGCIVIAIAVVLAVLLTRVSPLSRQWVVSALEKHYRCEVELKSFNVTLFPAVSVTGSGLVLRPRDQNGTPPLASIRQFSIEAGWIGLLRYPKHFRHVQLEGVVLNIPPRGNNSNQEPKPRRKKRRNLPPFNLGNVVADGTVLNIFSDNPQKPPRVFAISKLRLHSAGIGQAMTFQAVLTNPKPIGQIRSSGKFGPWNIQDAALTPISGSYAFQNADLSTIRGIGGILSSQGEYHGVLGRIEVAGKTDTPDFSLDIGGHPVPLKTEFNAIVDGTSGNTLLRPVRAEIEQSTILAEGGVFRTTGVKGKTILLKVSASEAQLQGLLLLAAKSPTPPILGDVSLQAKFDLSPGALDVIKRLKLAGDFEIQSARFTEVNVEQKLASLSRRGRGEHDESASGNTAFNVKGRFILGNGTMKFSRLSFNVPGAAVLLHGTYGLQSGELDFHGMLRLEATLSQTTTGVKSLLLKPIDPLFKKGGAGTVVPIKITGTRDQPSFGLDFGKLIKR